MSGPGAKRWGGLLFLATVWLSQTATGSGSLETKGLVLPLVCEIGKTCWVANYVDVDPSGVANDFRCLRRTYDQHDGVDFAIRDLGVMKEGVPVVATASGVVHSMRDGMEDAGVSGSIAGRECGNGVIVDHDGGWQTQYCHLRKGSVEVKPGDHVDAGTFLGLVGLSGKTEFPHVHLTVRRKGQVIDPFTGREMKAGCGLPAKPLWREGQKVDYEPVALYNAGFSVREPDIEAIRKGQRNEGPFPATSAVLIFWVDILGVQEGDRMLFRITRDEQVVLDESQTVAKTQARRFAYMGKRRPGASWPAGTYTGQVTLMRMLDRQDMKYSITSTATIQ